MLLKCIHSLKSFLEIGGNIAQGRPSEVSDAPSLSLPLDLLCVELCCQLPMVIKSMHA